MIREAIGWFGIAAAAGYAGALLWRGVPMLYRALARVRLDVGPLARALGFALAMAAIALPLASVHLWSAILLAAPLILAWGIVASIMFRTEKGQ